MLRHPLSRTERVWPVTAKEQAARRKLGKRGGTAMDEQIIHRPRADEATNEWPARRDMPYPRTAPDQPGNEQAQKLSASPSFPELETGILAFWKRNDTFRASVDQREGCEEWVFYDGPPFANGLPHYGHLLTGYAKDLFPRFQTMRGMQVHRRFGWDTHGLPAELEAMRQLGITEKSEIEQMGIAAFNAAARESVLKYTDEWQDYVTRQARWVDFENDYKTLDVTFMESVIWAFKELHDKGLAYEGFRVLPYCWNDETPLSNHELRMDDDVYKMRQDQTVTVTFPLVGPKAEALGLTAVRALAWTTTPWTLPTNMALAVGPDIDYAVVPSGPLGAGDGAEEGLADYLLAADTIGAYFKELGYESAAAAHEAVSRTVQGKQLDGVRYDRLWDFYADAETYGTENAWQILVADYVATGEGTGIVHQAPAYGEDDQLVTGKADIPVLLSVDEGGRFLPVIAPVAGMQVFDANKPLTQLLRAEGRLLKVASYEHSYPHCWRCRNPLIYKAVSSWFIRVPEFRDRMVELNEEITWVPDNVKHGQFGKWVGNARDWSISRNRYWGSPIPVWKSDNPEFPRVDVYGSLDELERDFGVRPTDLHRPYIDELTRPNPDDPTGKSTMRRVPEVLDCWFESGSMPFAQVHYPFENAEWFEHHYPGDFIVEYNGQTRGWFYTLHVLATALFDRPAFSNVVAHGIVLGDDGQKMSKSKRNYPDVNEVFERDGSDAMRWFLMSSPILRGGNLVVTEQGIREAVRHALLPLWNSYYFLALYANAEGVEGRVRTDSSHVLDRYILAKTRELVMDVQDRMDRYDIPGACASVREFLEVLTNWYIRRSRDRFWAGEQDVIDTLHTVLEITCRVAAPLLPLTTEVVWRGLTGGRSVHLTDWPNADELPADDALVQTMDRVRQVCSAALALRTANSLRVRLPLPSLLVAAEDAEQLEEFADLIRDEVNVKRLELTTDVAAHGEFQITVNARAAGPRLGKAVQDVIRAVKAGEWRTTPSGGVEAAGVELLEGEYTRRLVSKDPGAAAELPGGSGLVVLDTRVTPELAAEGVARDLVRIVQQARRDAGLDVTDRIV